MMQLSRRIAGLVVAATHPQACDVNKPRWMASRDLFDAISHAVGARHSDQVEAILSARSDEDLRSAFLRLWHELDADPLALAAARRHLPQNTDEHDKLRFDMLETFTAASLSTAASRRPVHVIVPFRGNADSWRRKNLDACLRSVARQTSAANVVICVVESDEKPQNADLAAEVSHYLFVPDAGPFNKSRALNAAARVLRHERGDGVLCILDADIVLPSRFVANVAEVLPSGRAALPYNRFFCVDQESSKDLRSHGIDDTDWPYFGYSMADTPGGCLVVDSQLYQSVGGFDESFVGWGGEDRDLINRLRALGVLTSSRGDLIHMFHDRPPMPASAEAIFEAAAANR